MPRCIQPRTQPRLSFLVTRARQLKLKSAKFRGEHRVASRNTQSIACVMQLVKGERSTCDKFGNNNLHLVSTGFGSSIANEFELIIGKLDFSRSQKGISQIPPK
jgi:hypothetical protein